MRIFKRRSREMEKAHDEARLMNAEGDVRELAARADRVDRSLGERDNRNHWRESIQQMIQGVV